MEKVLTKFLIRWSHKILQSTFKILLKNEEEFFTVLVPFRSKTELKKTVNNLVL